LLKKSLDVFAMPRPATDDGRTLTGYVQHVQQDPENAYLRVGDLGNTGNKSDSVTSFVKDSVDPVSTTRQKEFPAT
tara:strand:- start:167 stop:394 length:228 start_codon:yes stop_codon:yes gene_type:complete